MRLIMLAVVAVVLSPVVCLAQALSDRVPADALAYMGWRGVDDFGPGYDQSHLKAVLASSQMGALLTDALPKMITKLASQDPEAADYATALMSISGPIWHHPTAFYFEGMGQGTPMPRIALLCDAGADSASLVEKVNALIDKGGPDVKTLVKVKTLDHLVVVSTFDYALPENSLAKAANFQSALKRVPHDPVAMFYMDGAGMISTIGQEIDLLAPPDVKTGWASVRDSLGLSGLKTIVSGCGFEGPNWVEEAFIEAPSPRTGLFAMMDSKSLSDDTLKLIPSTATTASASVFDINALYNAAHDAVTKFNADAGSQWDQFVATANQFAGVDIVKDVLGAFGPEWATYADPATSGNGMFGGVLVNRARDAKALEASLSKIETVINGQLEQNLPHDNPQITLQFKQSLINGAQVHYFACPFITPSWTIKDGVWYFGLYPQVVASAIAGGKDGKSILDNPAYVDVRKRLGGPAQVESVSFADYPRIAPEGYQMVLMISRVYLGVGDLFGLDSPPLVIPPLDKIMPELAPGGQISWNDAEGIHLKGVTPFPGCQMLDAMNSLASIYMVEGFAMTGFWASAMGPHAVVAQERGGQVKSASNLRQIGQGILLYTNDTKGKYPADLGTLLTTEDLTGQAFLNPTLGHHLPDNWAQMSQDEQAKWVNDNSDYVYVGAGMTSTSAEPTAVVAYEKEQAGSRGINMLFGDGHVEFMNTDAAHAAIDKSKKDGEKPGGL